MKNSHIQWCDHTYNKWLGCSKKSQGCKYCYIERTPPFRFRGLRLGMPRQRTSDAYWKQPFTWNRQAEKSGVRTRVFCMSLGDWLDNDPSVDIAWFVSLLDDIRQTPWLDWQLLTKRPENWQSRMNDARLHLNNIPNSNDLFFWLVGWIRGYPPENVIIGATMENQEMVDERTPFLRCIPAPRRFISYEPALSECAFDLRGIDWLICGGESGPECRPMNLEWADYARVQCAISKTPFFMKQLGGNPDERGNIDEFPEHLKVRQFPQEVDYAHT